MANLLTRLEFKQFSTIRQSFEAMRVDAIIWKAEYLWQNAKDPNEQAMAMHHIVQMLVLIVNETKREGYIQILTKKLKIKREVLRREIKKNLPHKNKHQFFSGDGMVKKSVGSANSDKNSATTSGNQYEKFWIEGQKEMQIDRELVYVVAEKLGFRLYDGQLHKIEENFIFPVSERYFFDGMKAYIKEDDEFIYRRACNAWEAFIQKNGKFSISRLPEISDDLIVSDTKETSYKFFRNGVRKITAETSVSIPFSSLKPLLIWKNKIRDSDFSFFSGGRYLEYLDLAIGIDDDLKKAIGFLSHEYKDETTGYIIVLVEKCDDPEDGGGSGKNIFCNLFKHTTSVTGIPACQAKYDSSLMQSWDGERLFVFADAEKNFNYIFLKELSTGEGKIKKLYKNEAIVSSQKMPKFIIQTNYSFELRDGGLRRRIIPIEFTDFFSKKRGVDVYFGIHFPEGWNENDWNGYYSFIEECIQLWMKSNRKLEAKPLSMGGWEKQFQQTHGPVATEIIKENIGFWLQKPYITNEEFNKIIEKHFSENNIPIKYRPANFKIVRALTDYCRHESIEFKNNEQLRVAGINTKVKIFQSREIPF